MKPAPFEYRRPDTLAETFGLLQEFEDATIIAGGQSLMPMLNLRIAMADCLVDISRLDDLKAHSERDEILSLGALVTHAAIEDGCGREAVNGLLQRMASKIAYRTVRNAGTLGGSLALNDPAADWPVCMLALGATAVVGAANETRRVAMEDFLIDAYAVDLNPGELLLSIDIAARPDCHWGVSKVSRKSGAFADSLAVAVVAGAGQPARVALTATEGGARLLTRVSALLDADPRAGGAELARAIEEDIEDVHPDADGYKRRCHIHTVKSAISEAQQWSK